MRCGPGFASGGRGRAGRYLLSRSWAARKAKRLRREYRILSERRRLRGGDDTKRAFGIIEWVPPFRGQMEKNND